jgi:4-hydroxyphenylpyruvate dioxygenase
MNLIVNAHGGALPAAAQPGQTPVITAVALRVRDAAAVYRRALERGAWGVPPRVEVMELYIPAIHGPGASRIYFVDRYREFSIYDVDFTPIPGAKQHPPAVAGLHGFGIVQYIGLGRTEDWTAVYAELLGFSALADEERFGILPTGRVLRSPDGSFYLQLIEPQFDALEIDQDETLHRVAFGTPDVLGAVRELRARGIEFIEAGSVHTDARGALTRPYLGGMSFELVQHELPQ